MAIPEHNKCVKLHKQIRRHHQKKKWERVRRLRWKDPNDWLYPKARIQQILKVERIMSERRRVKKWGCKSIREVNEIIHGPHYRKYGKYLD